MSSCPPTTCARASRRSSKSGGPHGKTGSLRARVAAEAGLRILIVGAGALGGLVGAYLTRAGEDVTLLESNTARARLLSDIGLEVTQVGVDGTICVPLTVVSSIQGLPPF